LHTCISYRPWLSACTGLTYLPALLVVGVGVGGHAARLGDLGAQEHSGVPFGADGAGLRGAGGFGAADFQATLVVVVSGDEAFAKRVQIHFPYSKTSVIAVRKR
jgi:hypothetical protein